MDSKVKEETLMNFFKEYRSINSIKIITDPNTKLSRGYGFVKFTNYFEFQRALKEMNGRILMSKAIKVNQAGPRKNMGEYFNDNTNANYNNTQSAGNTSENKSKSSFLSNAVYDLASNGQNSAVTSANYESQSVNGNYGNNTSMSYNSTYPSNSNTKRQSNDSFKSSNSFKSFVNASINGHSGYYNPNASGISVNNSVNDELNCGEFSKNYTNSTTATTSAFNSHESISFENLLDSIENGNKINSEHENYFNLYDNYMSIPNIHGNFKRSFSNFYENRKFPLNNFLYYYYNIIDIDKEVNFLEQFYISFSKYGHSYECTNGKINSYIF